jgi:hypothetical protein
MFCVGSIQEHRKVHNQFLRKMVTLITLLGFHTYIVLKTNNTNQISFLFLGKKMNLKIPNTRHYGGTDLSGD